MSVGSEIYQAIKEHYPMSSPGETLDDLMQGCLQEGAFAVSGGRDLYMEVLDTV